MVIPSANVRRHFLNWERPLLTQAVMWLAEGWTHDRPLDLATTVVVVPTRQSGRRLREALAAHAAQYRQAVFPPRVCTPDALLTNGAAATDVASRLEALLAWTQVLLAADLAEFPDLFPVAPPRQDFAWAWRLAENFFRLQTQLTETGLAFADVVERAGANFPETDRWQQLGALESSQAAALRRQGLREPHAARRNFASCPALPPGVDRIVVLAVPDPLSLALLVLDNWAGRVPVLMAVFAPEDDAGAFDGWGRPLAETWSQRPLTLPEFERRVHLCADPAVEAQRMADAAKRHGEGADGAVALGIADVEITPLLENELSRFGLASYNPEGRARRGEGLFILLSQLAALARAPSFEAVSALARCPDVLAAVAGRSGTATSSARWLIALDRLREFHLPADLAAAREMAGANPELRAGLDFV
ncbi:MAG: ATP-dependent nuclease subunit B, partial [Opitutaceae bacterium]